jgi:aldose 1-epimerase
MSEDYEQARPNNSISPLVQCRPFGTLPDQTPVDLYTLTSTNGIMLTLITYGGIIVSLRTPNRDGQMDDIVLGFDTLEEYLQHFSYFGAIVGR